MKRIFENFCVVSENLSRMKKLEYLNLALNNIERIENLEGCESLQKLDLTVNFVGELTSVQSLKNNIHLQSLYLTGNPCADFKGYRKYVIVTLPQLKILDGQEIERCERILAAQEYEEVKKFILSHEQEYKVMRLAQKQHAKQRIEEEEKKYAEAQDKPEEERLQEYWSEVSDHSPETRMQIAEHVLKQLEQNQKRHDNDPAKTPQRVYKLFNADGKPLNVNEAKIPFILTENDATNSLVLDIAVYKYLDTALLDVDIQPTYVKVLVKGKIFQIVFPEEIKIESSTAQRSQTTGHLVINMPKMSGGIKQKTVKCVQTVKQDEEVRTHSKTMRRELLEIGRSDDMDFSKIVKINKHNKYEHVRRKDVGQSAVSTDFEDNPEVPPLE
ncbi:protein tilB homolog isoform X3 [Zootermopsis nevadensis]|uniref:protein tilB homolog isoform X3 n=1 Tax=Zootermopsis nevadensis TaxID=136037 RepID=UPI000B8E4764|nr:protein tilB homolog isoform X3 [Zootermopsis nevadensis]